LLSGEYATGKGKKRQISKQTNEKGYSSNSEE
jgi:hypothetical protein